MTKPNETKEEEARRLADQITYTRNTGHQVTLQTSVLNDLEDALRSLADENEKLEGQLEYAEEWTRVNFADLQKELAEARSYYKVLDAERWAVVKQRDEARAEIDRLMSGCGHDDPSWCDPMKCLVPRRKMDAWKEKYEAAVEVAWKYHAIANEMGFATPITKAKIENEIAARLAERGTK